MKKGEIFVKQLMAIMLLCFMIVGLSSCKDKENMTPENICKEIVTPTIKDLLVFSNTMALPWEYTDNPELNTLTGTLVSGQFSLRVIVQKETLQVLEVTYIRPELEAHQIDSSMGDSNVFDNLSTALWRHTDKKITCSYKDVVARPQVDGGYLIFVQETEDNLTALTFERVDSDT